MPDASTAWKIVWTILAGFSIVIAIRLKDGFTKTIFHIFVAFLIIGKKFLGWLAPYVVISALVINNFFMEAPLSCEPVGLHPYAKAPDLTDLSGQIAWISSPCTVSGKLFPFVIIGLAILSGCLGIKNLDS